MRHVIPTAKPDFSEVHTLEQLGQLVRYRRTTSGLRIDDAALLCDVSAGSLSNLEHARKSITADKRLRVMNGLGLALLIVPREELKDAWT